MRVHPRGARRCRGIRYRPIRCIFVHIRVYVCVCHHTRPRSVFRFITYIHMRQAFILKSFNKWLQTRETLDLYIYYIS